MSKKRDEKLASSETGIAAGIRALNTAVAIAQPHVLDDAERGKTVSPGKDRERHLDLIQAGLLGHTHFEKALGRFDKDMTAKRRRELRLAKMRARHEKRRRKK